jgi:transcriptional regulator with XRE-family HTH domain
MIALVRRHRNLTQADLSALTGKSRGVIAQIEKDMVRPDMDFLREFVRNLSIPFEVLYYPPSDFEHRLKQGDFDFKKQPKEDEKSGEKGVVYSEQKRGSLRGSLITKKENEKYIKPYEVPESDAHQVAEHQEHYGALSKDLKGVMEAQEALFRHLMGLIRTMDSRISDLEARSKEKR